MNNLIFIILLYISLINYNDCIKNLQSSKNDYEKIIGSKSKKLFGSEIVLENSNEANFVAAIVYVGPCCDYKYAAFSKSLQIFCTASIINEYYLLSSAFCLIHVEELNISDFRIIFHHDPLTEWRKHYDKEIFPFEYRLIKELKIHENYDTKEFKNDIGLILLDKPLDFTKTKSLSKIRMPYISSFRPYCKENYEVDVTDVNQKKCYLYHYGENLLHLNISNNEILKRLHIPIMEPRDCRKFDSTFDPKEYICAGDGEIYPASLDEQFPLPSFGEIGGPLVCVETNFKNFSDFTKHQVVGIFPLDHTKKYINSRQFVVVYYFESIKYLNEWIADNSEL